MPDMSSPVIQESGQVTMLDLDGKEYNAYWVDEKQNLFVPTNPLHFKAHKLQVLLARLDNQASRNPAQFNSKNYIDALNEYTRCVSAINNGVTLDEVLDKGAVGEERDSGAAPQMGAGASSGMDSGVSADNPLSGQGVHPTGAVSVSTGVSELPGVVSSNQQTPPVRDLYNSRSGSGV